MTLDDIRDRFPQLGLALYALEPGQPVTLEAHGPGGELWSWTAPTVAEVLAKAFPAPASGVSPAADPKGVAAAEPETVVAPTQGRLAGDTPKASVFD